MASEAAALEFRGVRLLGVLRALEGVFCCRV